MRKTSIHRVLTSCSVALVVALVVASSAVGCGTPTDPGAPEGPDAGLLEGTADCFGATDGAPCGPGNTKLCVRGVCSDPSCGDGIITAPEECDKGPLNGVGSGCETTTCKWSCLSTDAARNCQTQGTCATSGTCEDATHTCKAGGPKPTGSSCGPSKYCKGTECVDAVCGDAVVTPPETCDNGNANGAGTGCETSCKLSCVTPATDCPATPCNVATCTADHRCATAPDAAKNGQGCGAGLVCKAGACIAPGATCGNGILEGGEDCDLGAGNGPGTGCETICKFSCTGPGTQGSCVDMNACHATPTCTAVQVGGKNGQKCVTGANKADGVVCGVGSICLAAVCKPSACGDGFRDPARNEECDDGNVTKLDACDASCKFEQNQRVIAMQMQFGTDAFCTVNALGGAIGGASFTGNLVRKSFQDNIDAGIKDGSVSALFTFNGDLTGTTGAVTVGNLSGAPPSNAAPYNGASDLDWWYGPTASSIDATRTPRAILKGTYAGGTLDATGRLNLLTSVGGALASLAVSGAKITTPIGTSSVPTTSAAGAAPGHVAGEHLLPTLQSYGAAGGTAAAPTAQLCGNISASSLDTTAPPASLLPGGANACNEVYSTSNRLIDIIVHGCHVTGLNVSAIKATQPDQVDGAAPVAGAGAPYTLATDAITKRVTGCKDKNSATVPLQACLNAAAYSMSFKYATDRVIIK
jgi:cysteine-rich repeat protein